MYSEYGMVLLYIGGFGLSDLLLKWFHFTDRSSFIYYIILMILGTFIYYYTHDRLEMKENNKNVNENIYNML